MYDQNTALTITTHNRPDPDTAALMIDATSPNTSEAIAKAMMNEPGARVPQRTHLDAPRYVISFEVLDFSSTLGDYATSHAGVQPGSILLGSE